MIHRYCLLIVAFICCGKWVASAAMEAAPGIFQVGAIQNPGLKECSGIVPSRGNTNLFWMHSDGRRPVLYAVYSSGRSLREFILDIPQLLDWEDIATDHAGRLYVGDIGNNDSWRSELAVYEVPEPDLQNKDIVLKPNQRWTLRFPAKRFDCESLFVWKEYGYVVTKVFDDLPAELYRFALSTSNAVQVLEKVCVLPVTSPVTGGDISPDGKRVALTAKSGIFLFDLSGELSGLGASRNRQAKFKDRHVEGICFASDGLYATSEDRQIYRIADSAFGKGKGKSKNK